MAWLVQLPHAHQLCYIHVLYCSYSFVVFSIYYRAIVYSKYGLASSCGCKSLCVLLVYRNSIINQAATKKKHF